MGLGGTPAHGRVEQHSPILIYPCFRGAPALTPFLARVTPEVPTLLRGGTARSQGDCNAVTALQSPTVVSGVIMNTPPVVSLSQFSNYPPPRETRVRFLIYSLLHLCPSVCHYAVLRCIVLSVGAEIIYRSSFHTYLFFWLQFVIPLLICVFGNRLLKKQQQHAHTHTHTRS